MILLLNLNYIYYIKRYISQYLFATLEFMFITYIDIKTIMNIFYFENNKTYFRTIISEV